MLKNVDNYAPDPTCLFFYEPTYFKMIVGTATRPYNTFVTYRVKGRRGC